MNDAIRCSVRELIGFSFYPADILPTREAAKLMAGVLAHRGRQEEQKEGFEIERSISHTFACLGESVLLQGRMDAFADGDVPVIEEIKHSNAYSGDAAHPAHWAQAVCYGAMVTCELQRPRATLRVAYVDAAGALLRSFEETLDADELERQVQEMLAPYVRFSVVERAHRQARDASLLALPFPFERYRAGQREMAAQVYTAITRTKRLFATIPTGTGKSAAVLYPALKAMGQGKTGKILYLTARTTTRQSPLGALERMRAQGLKARVCVLTAKEKLCPTQARCHPDDCPRAKGHYLRQGDGIDELRGIAEPWTDEVILDVAQRHQLCPFELALALVEIADVVLMDYNYMFDPGARIQRLMGVRGITLLVDEAHHLLERTRDALSGEMDTRMLRHVRQVYAQECGRKTLLYKRLTELIRLMEALPPPAEGTETRLSGPPEGLAALMPQLTDLCGEGLATCGRADTRAELLTLLRLCCPMAFALENYGDEYATLLSCHGKQRALSLYCLLPGKHIAQTTKRLCGTVFFSATLSPLPAMKELLGGDDEDACFSLLSPFPPEHLLVVHRRVDTRYAARERTAPQVAQAIVETAKVRPGKYIAFFPSYAYLRQIEALLPQDDPTLPLLTQGREMDERERERFLAAFTDDRQPLLALCVLGGLFSEGIDLPGDRLSGAIIVGVGLPTPDLKLSTVRAYCEQRFGDGFGYACRIPGMQKVLQAAGRVIRSESDRGIVTLIDTRYDERDYAALLPPEWRLWRGEIGGEAAKLDEKET